MQQIGKYKVLRELGAGGFGAVYLCTDNLGAQVAIKMFQVRDANLAAEATSASGDAGQILRDRFLSEARVLRQLEGNPHIVPVYDFDSLSDGTPYYVMPYLSRSLVDEIGKDAMDTAVIAELPPELRPRRLPLSRGGLLLDQLLIALTDVHKAGLIHRDIKPNNLLFDAKGELRLCDFGIAKVPDEDHSRSMSGMAMGNRNYMAPEQRESAKHVDARADVYSFGVLGYRVLTGQLPVGRFAEPLQLCPEMGQALNDLILQCLAYKREDRPADASILRQLLKAALSASGESPAAANDQSGTWVESGKGEGGYKAAVSPLEQRVEDLLLENAEIPATAWHELNALAAIGGIGDAALQSLIQQVSQRLGSKLASKKNFLKHIDELVNRGEDLRSQRPALVKAAESVGWDARKLDAVIFDRQPRAQVSPEQQLGRHQSPISIEVKRGGGVASPASPGSTVNSWQTSRWPAVLAVMLLAGAGIGILLFQDDLNGMFPSQSAGVESTTVGVAQSAPAEASSYARPEPTPNEDAGAQQVSAEVGRLQQEQRKREKEIAEREQKLVQLSTQFDAQAASFKLTKPTGDNAAETLQSLKALNPTHSKVLEGAATLAGKYLELFERELNAGNLPKAAGYIELATDFTPESVAIADARERLKRAEMAELDRKQKAAEQARLEEERRREEEQARIEAERKRQQTVGGKTPGEVFKDCEECPEMVRVPTGSFLMGSEDGEVDEKPPHWVKIDYALAVGKFEVTYDEWEFCAKSGGCAGYAPKDESWGRGARPVINVSWEDAQRYVQWLSRRTNKSYRLLSEAEWEYAARGGTSTKFNWGNSIGCSQARYARQRGGLCHSGTEGTVVVGSFGPNGFGLHDMHGNVWEWTQDCVNWSFAGAPSNGSAWTSGDCSRRVLRGGSWLNRPEYLRSANRDRSAISYRLSDFGFRVARTD